jgi:hypothetical protein
VARRHAVFEGRDPQKVVNYMIEFRAIFEIEGIHPLEGGFVRMKYRADRRPSMGVELPGIFHLKIAAQSVLKLWRYSSLFLEARRIIKTVRNDPKRYAYSDLATAPVAEEDYENLALFTETQGADGAIARKKTEDKRHVEFVTSRAVRPKEDVMAAE